MEYTFKMKRNTYTITEDSVFKVQGTLQLLVEGEWVRLTDKVTLELRRNFNFTKEDLYHLKIEIM